MARRSGLGRGLGALIPPEAAGATSATGGAVSALRDVPVSSIRPNPHQPRRHFDEEALIRWPTAGFMNLRMHLDHMFSGGGLRWLDFEGTHRFGQRNGLFKGLSDHVPIVGTFTFG